jgi:hypothetical protein
MGHDKNIFLCFHFKPPPSVVLIDTCPYILPERHKPVLMTFSLLSLADLAGLESTLDRRFETGKISFAACPDDYLSIAVLYPA